MSRLNATLVRSHRAWALLLLALAGSAVWSVRNVLGRPDASPADGPCDHAGRDHRSCESDHLSHHRLDDEMSERWLKSYIKTLDPLKLYFTQADIDEFNQHKHDLDDMGQARSTSSYGHSIFKRFLQRIEERVKLADELLAEKHDFTVDENMVIEPDDAVFARNDAEVRDLWRKRVKYDLLGLMAEKAKAKAADDKKAEDKSRRRAKSAADGDDGPSLGTADEPRRRQGGRRQSRPTTSRLRRKNCRASITRSSSAGIRPTTTSCSNCT